MTVMSAARYDVHGFAADDAAGRRLADRLGAPYRPIQVRRFPDGESLVSVDAARGPAVVYHTLNDPNDKLIELLLAASALRDNGAGRLILVAPYLPYMRQDKAFAPGRRSARR